MGGCKPEATGYDRVFKENAGKDENSEKINESRSADWPIYPSRKTRLLTSTMWEGAQICPIGSKKVAEYIVL